MWHASVQGSHPQSAGQLLQSSQAGSQIPFPQFGLQVPPGVQVAHGPQPQSDGQLLQFSQAGSHVPSPQAG